MAIASFVNGVFQGMDRREQRDDRATQRTRNDSRWEHEESDLGRNDERWKMEQERHQAAMRRAARGGRNNSRDAIVDVMSGYQGGGAAGGATGGPPPQGDGYSIQPALIQDGGSQPLSYGEVAPSAAPAPAPATPAPVSMSAIPATPQATQPQRFIYIPGQGMIPRGVA